MATRKRTIGSVRAELVSKSRDAALCAIKVFNDPAITFKSETYIVLMVIAWTYLMHAYFRRRGIEYRYFTLQGGRRRFERTKHNAYRYWELERCLKSAESPVDPLAATNLRFLIGLRHEIEHQMTRALDAYLSGRYQACAINFNEHIKRLFGVRHGLDRDLAYTIQFLALSNDQIAGPTPDIQIPARLNAYITQFDDDLSKAELNSPAFSYRLLFTRKLANRPGQADRVVEFIDPRSDLGKTIDKEYWVKKEVERAKFRAKDVVRAVREAGFESFRIHSEHTELWKAEDARNPAKGYGVMVQGTWYWYQLWIDRCIALCSAAGDLYR